MNKIKTVLMLAAAQFALEVDGKPQPQVLKEVKDAGHTISAKTLGKLMKGNAGEIDGWTLTKTEVADEQTTANNPVVAIEKDAVDTNVAASAPTNSDAANSAPADAGSADATDAETKTEVTAAPPVTQTPVAEAASQATGAKGTGRAKKQTLWERIVAAGANPNANNAAKYEGLTEEQKKLAQEEEAKNPTNGGKISYRGTDWNKVLPHDPVPLKKGSKVHLFLEFLTTEGGVTKEQILEESKKWGSSGGQGWTAGGLAGVIHWEPKAKGYVLHSEKKDGKIHYSLKYHVDSTAGAGFVKPGEVAVQADKPAPAPKAPKAPKAAATDGTTSTPKVRVPKDGVPAGLPTGGATVTRRVAAKKA